MILNLPMLSQTGRSLAVAFYLMAWSPLVSAVMLAVGGLAAVVLWKRKQGRAYAAI
ncbi:MAG: hypothetical protein GY953_14725, partial [bacterium]|nr:hypothetical protein [bacterium]